MLFYELHPIKVWAGCYLQDQKDQGGCYLQANVIGHVDFQPDWIKKHLGCYRDAPLGMWQQGRSLRTN